MLCRPRRQPPRPRHRYPACGWSSSLTCAGAIAPSRSASTTCAASASLGRAHPTKEEVRQEYAQMWRQLGDSPDRSTARFAPDGRSASRARRWTSSLRSWRRPCSATTIYAPLLSGRMVNLSLEHGNSDASCTLTPWSARCWGRVSATTRRRFALASSGSTWWSNVELDRLKARVYLFFGTK